MLTKEESMEIRILHRHGVSNGRLLRIPDERDRPFNVMHLRMGITLPEVRQGIR